MACSLAWEEAFSQCYFWPAYAPLFLQRSRWRCLRSFDQEDQGSVNKSQHDYSHLDSQLACTFSCADWTHSAEQQKVGGLSFSRQNYWNTFLHESNSWFGTFENNRPASRRYQQEVSDLIFKTSQCRWTLQCDWSEGIDQVFITPAQMIVLVVGNIRWNQIRMTNDHKVQETNNK